MKYREKALCSAIIFAFAIITVVQWLFSSQHFYTTAVLPPKSITMYGLMVRSISPILEILCSNLTTHDPNQASLKVLGPILVIFHAYLGFYGST